MCFTTRIHRTHTAVACDAHPPEEERFVNPRTVPSSNDPLAERILVRKCGVHCAMSSRCSVLTKGSVALAALAMSDEELVSTAAVVLQRGACENSFAAVTGN